MIQWLDGITAVRTNSEMFIGDTKTPDHLAQEILDNAVDEISNGFASKIDLFYNEEDNSFWCCDNGRGIEVTSVTSPDDNSEKDSIEILCTKLFSGSKFDNNEYNQLIGMHGVGMVAVNSLSEWMVIKVRDRIDKEKIYIYTFQNAVLISREITTDEDKHFSTVIGFKPDKQYFNSIDFNKKSFVEKLMVIQSFYNLNNFTFNNVKIPKIEFNDLVYQYLGLKADETDNVSEIIYQNSKYEKIQIFLTFLEDSNNTTIGNVNLRFCEGSFINNINSDLKKIIDDKIDVKKFGKVSDKDYLNGLRMFILVSVPRPDFDSQIKSKMTTDIRSKLIDPIKNQLESAIDQYIDIIESNLETKIHSKITNNKSYTKTKRVSAGNKLRDCKIIPGNILYIVEGDSADGPLKEIRDKNYEASYPLKGKVLNVEKSSLDKISKNKEIKDLLEALGSVNNRRYKQIKILADADFDGYHISVLVLLVLAKYAPDLIKQGAISVIVPPLYGATKNNKFIPIYNPAKIQQYKSQGYNIDHFKGLGEMNPNQLEIAIRSGFEYKVKYPTDEKLLQKLLSIITNSELKRAVMNNPSIKMDIIINQIISDLKQKIN